MKYSACLVLLFLIALGPCRSMQEAAEVAISPTRTITGNEVQFECRLTAPEHGATYFYLMRTDSAGKEKQVVMYKVRCKDGSMIDEQYGLPSGSIQPSNTCFVMKIVGVQADREAVAGQYRCRIEHFMADFTHGEVWSSKLELTVGDLTPPLTQFQLTDAATKAPVVAEGQVAAGTNVSVVCETKPANPPPKFTVTVDDRTLPASGAAPVGTNKYFAYTLVPRSPRIVCRCVAFNGFGEKQSQEIAINIQYGADRAAVTIPEQVTLQSGSEVEICRVANNPPRRLQLSGLPDGALEAGYPRYEEKAGFSVVFIKLATPAEDLRELSVACGMPGEGGFVPPVQKTVKLVDVEAMTTQAPSSAMMTVGIVIAGIVLFVIVVAIVACALKRRSANKASNSEKAGGYMKANQNEGDVHHPTYEANAPGKPPINVVNAV